MVDVLNDQERALIAVHEIAEKAQVIERISFRYINRICFVCIMNRCGRTIEQEHAALLCQEPERTCIIWPCSIIQTNKADAFIEWQLRPSDIRRFRRCFPFDRTIGLASGKAPIADLAPKADNVQT